MKVHVVEFCNKSPTIAWYLPKFGVMTSPWYIENKYATLYESFRRILKNNVTRYDVMLTYAGFKKQFLHIFPFSALDFTRSIFLSISCSSISSLHSSCFFSSKSRFTLSMYLSNGVSIRSATFAER